MTMLKFKAFVILLLCSIHTGNVAMPSIAKKVLSNGLTVLVCPRGQIPKVSVQLWYDVGSKDENDGQRGLAHFIEHMIFKGTDTLSESDIDSITTKLSGSCNAFTSYDYTGYLFDFPTQHWKQSLALMSECMEHCGFAQDHINSEIKAVVQELKMYRDDNVSTLCERIIATKFAEHPYHHPIIGYKDDLLRLDRQHLKDFYAEHYHPANATLVVVGDVDVADVFVSAEQYFGSIKTKPNYKKKKFQITQDVAGSIISIYREVNQPTLLFSWFCPGTSEKKEYVTDIISWVLASGKGSRLYKKLVLDLGLATEVDAFTYDLFDQGLFFLYVQPNQESDIEEIAKIVSDEISLLRKNGISQDEYERATNKAAMDQLALFEDNQKLAYAIGKAFTATKDEQWILNYIIKDRQQLNNLVMEVVEQYLRPSCVTIGKVLSIAQEDKDYAAKLQQESDELDEKIISAKARESKVQPPVVAPSILIQEPKSFSYPVAKQTILANGLEVLWYHNPFSERVDLIVDLAHKHYMDPFSQQGRTIVVSKLLTQGTTTKTASELADEIERYGMSLSTGAGSIGMGMLPQHFERGLAIIADVVTHTRVTQESIDLAKQKIISDLTEYWDTPAQLVYQLAKEKVYGQHPYAKNILGTIDDVRALTREQIIAAIPETLTPQGSRVAIVGNLENIDIEKVVATIFSNWEGPKIEAPNLAIVSQPKTEKITRVMQRDQVVLLYAALSIARSDKDFDALLLFDQLFGGGVLGSMSSMLFAIRQQTGLFYTISGSCLTGTDIGPGMATVKTIVSKDSLAMAEKEIKRVMQEAPSMVTEEKLNLAKQAVINSLVDNFATNRQIASSMLFLRRHRLPLDYFNTRAAVLSKIELSQVVQAAEKVLSQEFSEFVVGRI